MEKTKEKPSKRPIKRSSSKSVFIGIGALAVAAIAFAMFYQRGSSKPIPVVNVDPETLPGIQKSEAPWPSELTHLRERLKIIGLPALLEEGTKLHSHQHIRIFIKGKQIQVPSGIGSSDQFITIVHTHDANGEIHIESPTIQAFTLGQFFDVWGVLFNSKCIGSYCEDQQNSIKVFVDGKPATGDPRTMELEDQQEIIVTYGTSGELPKV